MKIAFATHDMKTCDAHFGGAKALAIYEVSTDSAVFVEAVQFDEVSSESGDHGGAEGDDRLTVKIDALKGCALLFILAIGGPAAARVVNSRVHPIKLPAAEPIASVIERIQTMLKGSPPPWMRKILMQDANAMAFAEDDDE